MGKGLKVLYDCERCPAYCCSYPRIIIKKRDLKRLAKHHGISAEKARKRFTKKGEEPGERVLRHRKDEHYGSVCRFLDRDERMCTIYDARPTICRDYPSTRKCGYWEFLKFERKLQEDPEFVATAYNP
jgi:Fe-S-cluster containining protein